MPKPVRPQTLASHYALRRNGGKTVTAVRNSGQTTPYVSPGRSPYASPCAIDFPAAPGLFSPTTQHSLTSDVWEAGIHAATARDICAQE